MTETGTEKWQKPALVFCLRVNGKAREKESMKSQKLRGRLNRGGAAIMTLYPPDGGHRRLSRQAKHARDKRAGFMTVLVRIHRAESVETLQEAGELAEWDEPHDRKTIGEAIGRAWAKLTESKG